MKRTLPPCLAFLLTTLLLIGRLQAQTFVHPGIPFTNSDLAQLKQNLTAEPWLSAYNSLKADSRSQISYTMQGPFANVGRDPDLNLGQWRNDMVAIHNLAFMWIFTGDSAYARKATNILDAWATTQTIFSGGEIALDMGDYITYLAPGADILKSTFPGWSADNTLHVNNYFNLIWPLSGMPNPPLGNNQGALQFKTGIAVAAFLNDPVKWNETLALYRLDAGGGLRCSLPNGEVGDAGRDPGHWLGQAQALAWSAAVAWSQGTDVFTDLGNRLLAVSEQYSRFNTDTTGLYSAFIPFGGTYAYYTSYGSNTPAPQQTLMYNVIHDAYALRKGLVTPYTDALNNTEKDNGQTFLYRKSSDASTARVLPAIVDPATEVVSALSNIEIGNPGLAGSGVYDGNTWTLKGAGTSADAAHFAFKQVTGNVTIVARVTGNSYGNALTGVMIRQSPAAGANYVALNLAAGGGGTSVASRGMGASSQKPHAQPNVPWWLKLERINQRIYLYHSADGLNYTCMGSFISTLPDTAYLGLFTISNNTSVLNAATFTNVAITNSSPAGSPLINSATSASGIVGTPFTYAITATNNPTKYAAGGLPAGLSVDPATGVLSGTPSALGTTLVTLNATNANGAGTAILTLTISNNVGPNAPAGLKTSIVNSDLVSLSWSASVNATSYSVKRSLTSGGPYTAIATGVTGTAYTDAGAVPEITNYYVVTALSGGLESPVSNEVSAAVPPATPATPTITMPAGQIELSWPPSAGAVSYQVKRSSFIDGPFTTLATVAATAYVDSAVINGTGYYYVISANGHTLQSANSPEVFGVPGASAVTWSPVADSGSWKLPADWVEGTAPGSPAILTFKTSTDTVLTNDIAGLALSRILFDTTASAFTLNGNSAKISGDIVNVSPNSETVNIPLLLNGPLTVKNTNGSITFSDTLSGTGQLVKSGAGSIFLNGYNTYSGNTIIGGSATGWPPQNGIGYSGDGTGAPGVPASGALGTGTIVMSGGSLYSQGGGILYNNIELTAGTSSCFFQVTGPLTLAGNMTGSGNVTNDGNVYAGLQLNGDNSGFTGTFTAHNRSSQHRIRFNNAAAGSANAAWNLDNMYTDGQGMNFGNGTIHFGSLTGRGAIRNDFAGTVSTISIGALNTTTSFGGIISGAINIQKVGTASLSFTNNNTYTGTTSILDGTFLLDNNAVNGTFTSPVTDSLGVFGGTGRSTAPFTIGTGSGMGASLEPGNQTIGTLTTTALLTLNQDATYKAELKLGGTTSDTVIAGSITLNNPQLAVTLIDSGSLPQGDSFLIMKNTGSSSVTGTFSGLPEMARVTVKGLNFRITYKGGDGNDVVLLDERTVPLHLEADHLDGDNGQVSNNIIRPYLQVVNKDSLPVPFSELTMRYWFTAENYAGINTWVDYAQLGDHVKMRYVPLDTPRNGAFGYVEYSFDTTAGMLAQGGSSGPVMSRLANGDWSDFNESNDYSYAADTAYTADSSITIYRNGRLVWGTEPSDTVSVVTLKVYSLSCNSGQNTISNTLQIGNEGNIPVSYGDLSLRYWFTADGASPLNYRTDYARLGSANISGAFTRPDPVRDSADTYLEIKIDSSAGSLFPLSSTGNIQYRITKSDWSSFIQTNDHSYDASGNFVTNPNITLYYRGQLAWGVEPGTSRTGAAAANASQKIVAGSLTDTAVYVYPNPVTDNLYIRLSSLAANAVANVYSPNGILVCCRRLTDLTQAISLKALAPGVYFVRVINGSVTTTRNIEKK